MENKTTIDFKKIRSQVVLTYGVDLDETAIAILHILTMNQTANFKRQNEKLDAAISNINQSKQSLEASKDQPKAQAFWFAMGKWGMVYCLLIISLVICFLYWQSDKAEESLLPEKMKWYDQYYRTLKSIDPKTTKDFLDAYPFPN